MTQILAMIVVPFVVSFLVFRKLPQLWDKHRNAAHLMFFGSFILGLVGFGASIVLGAFWGPVLVAWMIYLFLIAGGVLGGGILARSLAASK